MRFYKLVTLKATREAPNSDVSVSNSRRDRGDTAGKISAAARRGCVSSPRARIRSRSVEGRRAAEGRTAGTGGKRVAGINRTAERTDRTFVGTGRLPVAESGRTVGSVAAAGALGPTRGV